MTTTPKKRPGRPRKALEIDYNLPTTPQPTTTATQPHQAPNPGPGDSPTDTHIYKDIDISIINNIDDIKNLELLEVDINKDGFSMKSQMTQKELRFIEIYLSGNYNQINAMKLAGYESKSDQYLGKLATKIVWKYERGTPDKRDILRMLGFGEVKVMQLMIEAATGFRSETVKQKARETLGSWLGLKAETFDGVEGITIIIQGREGAAPGSLATAEPQKALPAPTGPKTRMIK